MTRILVLKHCIGRSLNQILGKQGEEVFHRCETEIISHCIGKGHVVVVLEESLIAMEENHHQRRQKLST